MLTLQVINADPEGVIAKLAKKHFDAREPISRVVALDKERRAAQTARDGQAAQLNKLAAQIGALMKQGKKDEAEATKAQVAEIKENNRLIDEQLKAAEDEIRNILLTIPNMPYDLVPEGVAAGDNLVVKSNLSDEVATVAEWKHDAVNDEAKVPHWELAKKYNLIDFDLGVKITGAGFPVYIGKGARMQRALIQFFLDEANAAGYTEIMPPTVVNEASGYGTGQLPDKEGQMYHCGLDNLYLIPTAEVPVTNIYRDVILDEK